MLLKMLEGYHSLHSLPRVPEFKRGQMNICRKNRLAAVSREVKGPRGQENGAPFSVVYGGKTQRRVVTRSAHVHGIHFLNLISFHPHPERGTIPSLYNLCEKTLSKLHVQTLSFHINN